MTSKDEHTKLSENRLESKKNEGTESVAGKPITSREENAVQQREELLTSLKVHRFTKPDQQPFVIDMGTEKITDRRPIAYSAAETEKSNLIPIRDTQERSINAEDRREHVGIIIRDKSANTDHAHKLDSTIEQLPENLKDFLAAHNIKIVAVRTVIDEFPELKFEQPRDWGKHTWSNVEGTYRSKENEVAVGEIVLGNNGQWQKNTRVDGVARHETGHAIDHALGDFSLTNKEFIDAYKAEKDKLSPADQKTLEYILQKGSAGQQEAFGELFATLYGGASLDETGKNKYTELLKRCFPKTLEVIQNKMESI